MEEDVINTIEEYFKEKKLSIRLDKDYKKVILKTKDILIDAELLREILNKNITKKSENDYCSFITSSCRFYMDNNKDVELNFSYLLNKYNENILSIYKYISIFHECVLDKNINVKEPVFNKYNTDEIKIFSRFLLHCINKKDEINFEKFIYVKYFDLNKFIDMKQKNEFPKNKTKIIELIENCKEIINIFDEIFDTKVFTEIGRELIEYNKIGNNKLFITEEKDKFKIQMMVKKENFKDIIELIKKIKNKIKDIEIVLFVNEVIEDFYILLKEGVINNLIVKNKNNKNLIMLKNNKDLFIYYDSEIDNSYQVIENQFNDIKKILNDYFETLYLVFNKDYKIHKIKITSDLSIFGYFIKDKVMQNYFTLNEYKEEKTYYSIYLYSKDNKLCYDIFCLINPEISKVLSLWLNNGIKKIDDKIDSLILINGFELMLKSTQIQNKIYYNKIILQVDSFDKYKNDFEIALKKKNIHFHTKNIYYIKNLKDYKEENNYCPTTTLTTYNKRGFNSLIPFLTFVYKKNPKLNKKPILLQISYFLSYNLKVFGIENELDK